MSTPLERAADAIQRRVESWVITLQPELMERFCFDLADAALGAARLPEELHAVNEARTANLLALHQALASTLRYHPGREPYKANERIEAEMVQILVEVDKRLGRG